MNIRNFNINDYFEIAGWWNQVEEPVPSVETMPVETTYIVEDTEKIASVSLYLTNTFEVCYIENLIANPTIDKDKRKEAINLLIHSIELIAKDLGYKRLICFTREDKLNKRYQDLGYHTTVNNLYSLVKEL